MSTDLLSDIRGENLKIYHTSAQRLREDIGQEDEIARDYRGRLIYELIQNADDATETGDSAQLLIELQPDGLWFANSGRELVEGDVRGICGISASTKRVEGAKKRASIGHKGMGFKSVLEISRAPEVYSTSYSFRFDEAKSLSKLSAAGFESRHAPLMRLPWPIEYPRHDWQRIQSSGFTTAFYLPFAETSKQSTFSSVTDALRSLPETTFLFLKRLERIEVVIGDERRSWQLTREQWKDNAWDQVASMEEPGLYRIHLDARHDQSSVFLVAHDGNMEIGPHRGGLAGVAWEDVDVTEVSVAVQLDAGRPVPIANPLVHVFLPTAEKMPYPFLVNGAFTSGLSRQSIRVEQDLSNYNAFLVRHAAYLFSHMLIPTLATHDRRGTILLLERNPSIQTPLAQVMYQALRDHLWDHPLIPAEDGSILAPCETILPPLLPKVGQAFRSVLPIVAKTDQAAFPEARWCAHDVATVLADHGARVTQPTEAAAVLASADPERSRAEDDMDRAVVVDPVLRILQMMWESYDEESREALVNEVRRLPLMPVELNSDRSWRREAVGERASFYPPQFLKGEVPLPGLCFLSQSICWGALNRQERQETLKKEMIAWHGLFGLQEFKFPEVMRASVLPLMRFDRSHERSAFHDTSKLAAICKLSGKTSQGGHLPTERLGSQRALFNLSRLDVPCRGPDGTVRWVAAYRVYFGKDWIGERSVECLLEACQAAGQGELPDIPFVLGPEHFAGYLKTYESLTDEEGQLESNSSDEVGLDEDEEAALPMEERDRWREFLSWLGVNEHLRAVHFHDVEDYNSQWLSTENLTKPRGWIFKTIPDELWAPWHALFKRNFDEKKLKRTAKHRLWFYDVHHLEYLDQFLILATLDEQGMIGRALYQHIQAHWSQLRRVEYALAALTEGSPTHRKLKRAKEREKVQCCENFWLWRLKQVAFCPTVHGPRLPAQTWLPGKELERRFRRTGPLLPVLDGVESSAVAAHLGIRPELTPSAFTIDDAEVWLERLERVSTSASYSRHTQTAVTVACRHLMELLTGKQPEQKRTDVKLPAHCRDQLVWLPANQIFFAERRRADKYRDIPIFVLESEPRARAPLQACFGVRLLEESLTHEPTPGDPSLHDAELDLFRTSIMARGPALLARLGAERQEERQAADDARRMKAFLQGLLPVSTLEVSTTLDGQVISDQESDSLGVFVDRSQPACAFVRWGEQGWPPADDDAERLAEAICEVFGPNWYESFLAIIKARDEAAWIRILRRAGAPVDLEEYRRRLAGEMEMSIHPTSPLPTPKTAGQLPVAPLVTAHKSDPVELGDVPLHPLWSAECLVVLGCPVQVFGHGKSDAEGVSGVREHGAGSKSLRRHTTMRTDLSALDHLGMQITMSFEQGRLDRNGGGRVFDVSHPALIQEAWDDLREVFEQELFPHGIASDWPGFDLLSLDADGQLNRMIELKSSGVSARTQECTWNEWKSAGHHALREKFFLYLVGNLRSDLRGQRPFVRTVQDPFGQLRAEVKLHTKVERKIQLAVSRFREAEEEVLDILPSPQGDPQ